MKKIVKSLFSKSKAGIEDSKEQPANTMMSWEGELIPVKRFQPFTCNFMGHSLHVHDSATFLLGINELFEGDAYKFVSDKESPYIIDCGANLGMSMIYFKSLYPQAEILAIEADPNIFSFLKSNITSYAFSNVTALNNAVWNSTGETLSFLTEGGAGGRLEAKSQNASFTDVKTIRLKDFLNRPVDFLKIDVEGAEFQILEDCAAELNNVKNLFIEYHSFHQKEQNLHRILEIVHSAGFTYHIKEAYVSPHPFIERNLNFGMDLLLSIYCYKN